MDHGMVMVMVDGARVPPYLLRAAGFNQRLTDVFELRDTIAASSRRTIWRGCANTAIAIW